MSLCPPVPGRPRQGRCSDRVPWQQSMLHDLCCHVSGRHLKAADRCLSRMSVMNEQLTFQAKVSFGEVRRQLTTHGSWDLRRPHTQLCPPDLILQFTATLIARERAPCEDLAVFVLADQTHATIVCPMFCLVCWKLRHAPPAPTVHSG